MKTLESFPKGKKNTVGKGEIGRNEQFHLFWQCFQKSCTSDTEKQGLSQMVNPFPKSPLFSRLLKTLHGGKGENAGNPQHFLLF